MSDDAINASAPAPYPIQHIFVLMLENRSFDHLFALSGIPGIVAATSANTNRYEDIVYRFENGAPEQLPSDPGHEFADVVEQLCGEGAQFHKGRPYPPIDNSGFAANYATSQTEGPIPPQADIGDVMRAIDTRTQAPALYTLATEFVLCDGWHSSMPGPTWPNRFFLHGASSAGLDHTPTDSELAEWETFDGFTYPRGSIFDALGENAWQLYQDQTGALSGRIPQVSSLKGIDFFDVDDLSHFEADLAQGYTARYTLIEPNYGDMIHQTYENGTSQHPMDSIAAGDQLVGRVYNAIRQSPLWDKSLFVILYDEHGGLYDSVKPGTAPPPNDGDGASAKLNASGFAFDVYGVRVPAIVVSPWVAKGYVDHTVYDHSSILATIERLFGIAPLTDRDGKAHDLLPLVTTSYRTDCPGWIGS
jgi:phospholipase C